MIGASTPDKSAVAVASRRFMRLGIALALAFAGLEYVAAAGTGEMAPQSGAGISPKAISEVSLERHCFACRDSYRMTFRRDGTATHVTFGVARFGTLGRTRRGAIRRGDFEHLAAAVVAERFFEMAPLYRDPTLADGEAVTIVVTSGRAYSVTNSNHAAPRAFANIESAIGQMAKSVTWTD